MTQKWFIQGICDVILPFTTPSIHFSLVTTMLLTVSMFLFVCLSLFIFNLTEKLKNPISSLMWL